MNGVYVERCSLVCVFDFLFVSLVGDRSPDRSLQNEETTADS